MTYSFFEKKGVKAADFFTLTFSNRNDGMEHVLKNEYNKKTKLI